jgi:hypothetical protein
MPTFETVLTFLTGAVVGMAATAIVMELLARRLDKHIDGLFDAINKENDR